MVKIINIEKIRFDGGKLCLNYINTVHNRFVEPRYDYLQSVNDLIQWAFRTDVIDSDTMKTLKKTTQSKAENANAFFTEAINLRDILFKMFLSTARDKKIPEKDLMDFNELLSNYFSHLKITHGSIGYTEEWNYPGDSFFLISAPILKDAYDLLLLGKQNRIRECPNCGWLFYDSSKNGTRRWCSMTTCGSNVKALNWYHKHKTGGKSGTNRN
jgi:predicted RNA-binding Zn ribbon-like protein